MVFVHKKLQFLKQKIKNIIAREQKKNGFLSSYQLHSFDLYNLDCNDNDSLTASVDSHMLNYVNMVDLHNSFLLNAHKTIEI